MSSEIPLPPLKTLPTTSEGTTLSRGNFPAPLFTEAVIAETRLSDRDFTTPLFTIPAISEEMFSEIPLPPLKTLPTTSEGTRLASGNFPAPFLTEAVIAETRLSDRDLTTPLPTISAIAETRLSDVLRNPWNTLVRLSDITDTELSEIERAPLKTLPTTSEGTRLTCANFPAPLLTESVIETTSERDFATPFVTTSEIVDARFSDVVLNPVKTLAAASEVAGVSDRELTACMLIAIATETTCHSDI